MAVIVFFIATICHIQPILLTRTPAIRLDEYFSTLRSSVTAQDIPALFLFFCRFIHLDNLKSSILLMISSITGIAAPAICLLSQDMNTAGTAPYACSKELSGRPASTVRLHIPHSCQFFHMVYSPSGMRPFIFMVPAQSKELQTHHQAFDMLHSTCRRAHRGSWVAFLQSQTEYSF